eukprot:TRINITY_DN49753_c0_g1_i1.p1 TRINITY_DN49753_c0_g1~~TRINITY_DN49753_c0_g1_i1.p1  ORF type:complete len:313 (-),score=53.89 TRINITY_DN49753_c0_g1_i1:137-1075(-)
MLTASLLPQESDSDLSSEESSSSSSSDGGRGGLGDAKRRRLAVPACVAGLVGGSNGSKLRDRLPSLRRIPHVDGNFATLVYLAVPAEPQLRRASKACAASLRRLAGPVASDSAVQVNDPDGPVGWHVSLCPLLMLRKQFIDPFLAKLAKVAATATGQPGWLYFDPAIEVFGSSDGVGRFFAGLAVAEPSASSCRCLSSKAMECAKNFGLLQNDSELVVGEMRPHCSLAWTACDLTAPLARAVDSGTSGGSAVAATAAAERRESSWGVSWRIFLEASEQVDLGSFSDMSSECRSLCVRVGDRVHQFPFSCHEA